MSAGWLETHSASHVAGGTALDPTPARDAQPEVASPSSGADAWWARSALVVLLGGTLALYLWALSHNGWGNEFYSAAVQAGSKSWKAFLFGSSDAGNTITVDKPPMSLWPQALTVRIFGLSSWSLLVPQALMGVGAVAVLYADGSPVVWRRGGFAGWDRLGAHSGRGPHVPLQQP